MADRNREIAEQATGHREWIETEMQDSDDHLNWIQNRLESIAASLVQLNVTRCESNQLFIQQLKEHQDALDAIAILRTELDRTEAAGQAPVFAQTEGSFSNKLAEYEHLFESFQDFSNRHQEAQVQAQLERRQLGEQFRVLESAFIAPEPSKPNLS